VRTAAVTNGNVADGIMIGSLSGLIPSVTPFGSGAWASFGNQIASDAIRGGLTGGVSAMVAGGDIGTGMVKGAVTFAIAGQVNNVIGHTIGFVGSGLRLPTYNSTLDVFVYSGNKYGAITFGNVIYGDSPALLGHEYIHVRDYSDFGIGFLPAYVAQFPVAMLSGNNPFIFNLFELHAQQCSGYPD